MTGLSGERNYGLKEPLLMGNSDEEKQNSSLLE
jgi:hypothetical protein